MVFLLTLGLGKALEVYSTASKRAKEAELIHVGGLYREAIRNYYLSSPGAVRQYPERLEDLLRDPRHLETRRYIRKLYSDPVSGKPFDLLMAPEGGIRGVTSPGKGVPFKESGFPPFMDLKPGSGGYGDWHFVYYGEPR